MMIRSARSIELTVLILIRIREKILRRSIDKKTAAPSPVAENREFHAQVQVVGPLVAPVCIIAPRFGVVCSRTVLSRKTVHGLRYPRR